MDRLTCMSSRLFQQAIRQNGEDDSQRSLLNMADSSVSYQSKISGYSSFESESNEMVTKNVQTFDSIEKMKNQLKSIENDLKATLTQIDIDYDLSFPSSDHHTTDFMSYSTQATNKPKCPFNKCKISAYSSMGCTCKPNKIKSKLARKISNNPDEFLDELKSELLSNIEDSFDWEDPLYTYFSSV